MVSPPFFVSYAVTGKCNLKCKHCYTDATDKPMPGELSTQESKRLLDDLASWGIKFLVMDGGEPLCRDDFFEIARYASGRGLRVGVGSNGISIDERMATRMLKTGIQVVGISIDGANPKTHDSFRGKEGAFSQAVRGVKACKKAGLPFQFNTVIRKPCLPEIPDILRLAVESGAVAIEFFDLTQVSRVKRECADEILSVVERRRVMDWLAQTQKNYPILIRVTACPMYPLILKKRDIQPIHFPTSLLQRIPYYDRGCAAGIPNGYVTVLPNGDVVPCMLLQIKLGNVKKESIIEMWEKSPVLAQLRRRELLQGLCGECRYRDICAGCRGRAYNEIGNILAADPGCWIKP